MEFEKAPLPPIPLNDPVPSAPAKAPDEAFDPEKAPAPAFAKAPAEAPADAPAAAEALADAPPPDAMSFRRSDDFPKEPLWENALELLYAKEEMLFYCFVEGLVFVVLT